MFLRSVRGYLIAFEKHSNSLNTRIRLMLICVILDYRGVGIDCVSFDAGRSPEFGVHTTLFAQNVWGLENVANLGKVPATGATVRRCSTLTRNYTKNFPSELLLLKKWATVHFKSCAPSIFG